ncbi:DUF4376 domain-containing protein [Stappia stellulata]|uniref:DUF4376 domain-containing protein n=1 Tax=Stappia stellulata TaxID=71235 RepID=UPI001CD6C68A|nr:DUF4376 domain-containing protein [Stappia stellulata]MCA1242938.1 DUF4376 domain-containing protein [Stappia stellulata]
MIMIDQPADFPVAVGDVLIPETDFPTDTQIGSQRSPEGSWSHPAPAPPPTTADLNAHLSAIRRTHETGGVSVTIGPDVIEVATDHEGKTNLLGARVAAQEVPGFTTDWSAINGIFPLDAAGIIALSDAVLAHINGAFVAQAAVIADIDAGTLTTPAEVEAAFAAAVAAA